MNIFTHVSAVLVAVSLTTSSVVRPPNNDGNFELLILHNNDMHARFEQTSQLSGACTLADREAGKCYGGFPRVAHVVKEARRQAQTGEGPPVLYLNAGDTYTGTAWFTIYKWKIAAEFMNALQPDAVAMGNNDIEKDSHEVSQLLQNLNNTVLATNVILKNFKSNDNIHKSIILDIKGVKVGLVSYLTPDLRILDAIGDVEYVDEIIALQYEVTLLQEQNVKIIIALGHSSRDKDLRIAQEVEGLDLIISGHRNVFYWNGTNTDTSQIDHSTIVTQRSGKEVPIINSYSYDKYLGKISVVFDTSGDITSYDANPILLDETIPLDTEAQKILMDNSGDITFNSEEIVGQTAVVLDGESCKVEECNLGNMIADAINYYYAINYDGERWTDSPVTFIPGGAIAASISPLNRPAPVTVGDLMNALPFESNIVAVTMTGAVLLEVLEHSVSFYSTSSPTGQLLQFSGVRAVYDLSREPGSRLVSAFVRCWSCFVPQYYTIDDWRQYRILMPAALADGSYGFTMISELTNKTSLDYDEVTCTTEYIRRRSPVYPDVAGRIQWQNYDAEPDMSVPGESGPEEGGSEEGGPEETNPGEGTPDSASSINLTLALLFISLIPVLF